MAVIHISEAEAGRDFAKPLSHLKAGGEVVIDDGLDGGIRLQAVPFRSRTLKEVLALLPRDTEGVVDEDFERDVQAGIDAHREDYGRSELWD